MWNHIVRRPDMFTIRNTTTRTHSDMPKAGGYAALFIGLLVLLLATVAAWITHIVVSIKASAWFLLLFGILAPPIGIVHGVGVWLGIL